MDLLQFLLRHLQILLAGYLVLLLLTVGYPAGSCPAVTLCGNATDSNNLFPNGTFGFGGADGTNAQINGPALAPGLTQYAYQPLGYRGPEDGFYAITNNTFLGSDYLADPDPTGTANPNHTPFSGSWWNGFDHTPGEPANNGYQMVVNASYAPDIVISKTLNNLCSNKKYQFSAWIRNLDRLSGQIPANLTFLVNGVGLYKTGDIPTGAAGQAWRQVGFTFQASGATTTISIRNNQTGGVGNDWALDDIYVGSCNPTVVLTPLSTTCSPLDTAYGVVTDASLLFDTYQ
ncbi:MAG: hypothetical protein HY305_02610, partial [Sphingobacteriales bacterium]|nr:hypothetical protein [Sphingobacteriales bacterium]